MAEAGAGVPIHVSGRGVVVSAVLRRRVEAKLTKVRRLLPKISEARVVLSLERYRHLAEITLQAKGKTLRAEAEAADFHTAVDDALLSLERQARRRKDRIRERKPRPSRRASARAARVSRAVSGDSGEPAAAVELPAGLVMRRIGAKPMSVDEALEQMRMQNTPLLVFTNARSQVVNVLHRRADGALELVEPAR